MATFLALGIVLASSKEDIVFPVVELGGCENKEQCKMYCDNPDNIKQCVGFAEKHNLLGKDEIEKAKRFMEAGNKGPGECNSQKSCEEYCNNINNMDECLAFAETHGMMDDEELEEAKKVQSALKRGAKLPGGCENKNECEQYCENSEHMEECIAFAETAGFIPPDELEDAKKALSAIKKGIKPPPCRGKKECDNYCGEPQNFESCLVFAEAAGFISEEEAEMARKTGGRGPGDCRGKDECDEYCQRPENVKECVDFVETAQTSGPGGCKSKKECEEFCQKPENTETCLDFAAKSGMMSPEESEKIKNMMRQAQPIKRPDREREHDRQGEFKQMTPPEFESEFKLEREKIFESEKEKIMEQIPPEFREIIPREMPDKMPPPPSSEPMPQILPFKKSIDNAKALILEILR